MPRNLVDGLTQALNAAGVAPYLMDLRPLALARAANRGEAIVVNLDPDCFDIVFITGGLPAVIHTISPRGEGATLEDNIHRLVDELTKMAAFYQSRHPESQPGPDTPLLLTGDLAAEAAAGGLLQSEVEYPVSPLTPPVEFPADLPVAAYAATIGLALKKTPPRAAGEGDATPYHDIDINLLSGKLRQSRAKSPPARDILLWVFVALAVVLIFPLYQARARLVADNAGRQDQLFGVSRELNLANLAAEAAARTEKNLRDIAAGAASRWAANQAILAPRGDFTRDLGSVTRALPAGARFTFVEIESDLINVRGEADNVFAAVAYATALEGNDKFTEVRITKLDEGKSIIAGKAGGTPSGANAITFEIFIKK